MNKNIFILDKIMTISFGQEQDIIWIAVRNERPLLHL